MDINYENDEEFDRLSEATRDLFSFKKKPENQEITMQLIIKRNLISTKTNATLLLSSRSVTQKERNDEDDIRAAKSAKAEEQAEKLLKLTHIHLDRENIVMIDNLAEYLGPITNLYLQHNLIERIENLDFLKSLKFLVLANNRIRKIENLKCLKELKFLDLSFNCINEFDVDELPDSLSILDLRGNRCIEEPNSYKEKIEEYLKNIEQLNGEQLKSKYQSLEFIQNDYAKGIPLDDSEENLEESIDEDVYRMREIGESIIERSRKRQKDFEIKSKKSFELVKLELEKSKRELLEKLSRSSLKNSSIF